MSPLTIEGITEETVTVNNSKVSKISSSTKSIRAQLVAVDPVIEVLNTISNSRSSGSKSTPSTAVCGMHSDSVRSGGGYWVTLIHSHRCCRKLQHNITLESIARDT